jgi:hypothetical protein
MQMRAGETELLKLASIMVQDPQNIIGHEINLYYPQKRASTSLVFLSAGGGIEL